MKVREAIICLDCDEIRLQTVDFCPRCLSKSHIELRQYLPSLSSALRPVEMVEECK